MNNKSSIWITIVVMVALVSCKKETLPQLKSFTASKGTFIGVVHLAIEQVPGAENCTIERKNPQTNQWEGIHWGNSFLWDDNGWGLPNNKLIPGQVYEYRARAHAENTGFNDWSETATGYLFSPSPKLVSLKYTLIDPQFTSYNIEYTINDTLPDNIENLRERRISLYRSETSTFSNIILYKTF